MTKKKTAERPARAPNGSDDAIVAAIDRLTAAVDRGSQQIVDALRELPDAMPTTSVVREDD